MSDFEELNKIQVLPTCYKTSDGRVFDNIEDAKKHQSYRTLREAVLWACEHSLYLGHTEDDRKRGDDEYIIFLANKLIQKGLCFK